MDFNLDETQAELRDLTAGLLAKEATQDRLEAHEKSAQPYDDTTWKAMAQAGLLGACLPEEVGGAGLGPIELAVILREVGAHVAPVPVLPSLVSALIIGQYGTAAQRRLLGPLAEGESVLTFALREPGDEIRTTARKDGDIYRLDGVKTFVAYAEQASHILVAADDGVYLIEPGAVAVHDHPLSTGEPGARLALEGTPATPLAAGARDDLRRLAQAGIAAIVSGVLAGALKLTTEYVKTREQFGRPLAQFQAVTMQVADVYIAGRALDVAAWAGAWRLAAGHAEADEVLAVAAYNACDPVLKALYTCQHLHGGVGLDVTYPLHRYFAWAKHYAHLLGGAEAQLDTIGALV